jgi:hypothetical protein
MATEGTKFQVNYKLADGTLINVYAATAAELESGLSDLAMNAALIKSTGAELGASGASSNNAANVIAAAFPGATPVQSSVIEEGSCKHGKLVYRTSKPGALRHGQVTSVRHHREHQTSASLSSFRITDAVAHSGSSGKHT